MLIFPTEVDGRKVVGVYYEPSGMFHDGHSVIAPNLERLYFTDYVYIDSLAIHRGFKILYLFNVKYETVLHYWHSFIFPEIDYLNLCSCCFPANVVYRYNYDGALQKNYWLDDYDNEVVKYPPAAPVRDGYEFAGWYKEPECINKWNFETDVVPEKKYSEEITILDQWPQEQQKYINAPTFLYAKWVDI